MPRSKSSRISTLTIENCSFELECNKNWDELDKTPFRNVRYCTKCSNHVHRCKTNIEIQYAVGNGWCVAVDRVNIEGVLEKTLGMVRDEDIKR